MYCGDTFNNIGPEAGPHQIGLRAMELVEYCSFGSATKRRCTLAIGCIGLLHIVYTLS